MTKIFQTCFVGLAIVFMITPGDYDPSNSALAAPTKTNDHGHGNAQEQDEPPPKIFLDKNPRIVKFQLKRLSNARLLKVERRSDDPKYLPVHQEIILRSGMTAQDRETALLAITKINGSDCVSELLTLLKSLPKNSSQPISRHLSNLLLSQPRQLLDSHQDKLLTAAKSKTVLLQRVGMAALIVAGQGESAIEQSRQNEQSQVSLLACTQLLPSQPQCNSLHPIAISKLNSQSDSVRREAIEALALMTVDPKQDFLAVAKLIDNPAVRASSVKTLLKIPRENRDKNVAADLAKSLIEYAESTPTTERTSEDFIRSMQLVDQLLGLLPQQASDDYRQRMENVAVRTVIINTVEEEMRYDVPWFAVQAGKNLEIVFKNDDLMAHNLVITAPQAMKEVALAGAALGTKIGKSGKQYVPASDKVIVATKIIQSNQQTRLSLTAPKTAGEYPYVCTFPGHWLRMYGVMVVVDNLAEFQRNPTKPKDPLGQNRPFVKAWKVADFEGKIENGLRQRNPEIGKRLFAEATCSQCHRVAGEGKAVGPELTDVWKRLKGSGSDILREIIEPSHKIEAKYILRKIVTLDGEVLSGIVLSENDETISILPDPESTQPTVIQKDDIDEMIMSSVSIMPKGLMNHYTEDEIFELLGYLKQVSENQ